MKAIILLQKAIILLPIIENSIWWLWISATIRRDLSASIIVSFVIKAITTIICRWRRLIEIAGTSLENVTRSKKVAPYITMYQKSLRRRRRVRLLVEASRHCLKSTSRGESISI